MTNLILFLTSVQLKKDVESIVSRIRLDSYVMGLLLISSFESLSLDPCFQLVYYFFFPQTVTKQLSYGLYRQPWKSRFTELFGQHEGLDTVEPAGRWFRDRFIL